MVDKAVAEKKKPEETVTIEEEDLFEDFPPGKGDTASPTRVHMPSAYRRS